MPKTHLNNYQWLVKRVLALSDDPKMPWQTYPCLEWPFGSHEGYGYLRVGGTKGKTRRTHRVAYEIVHGALADPGLVVCHHCDNPRCFRPSHLFAGTSQDNALDMAAKGRRFQYDSRGERHGMAKFSIDDVQKMHILRLLGVSNGQIAKLFSVRQSCVSRITTGKRWRHFTFGKADTHSPSECPPQVAPTQG